MLNFSKIILLLFLSTIYALGATENEVKQLVNDAVKYCKQVGQDECFKVFSDKKGKFTKGELYIFAIRYDGITMAHGGNNKLVGKNLIKVKEPTGKMLIQELILIAKNKGEGWFDYKWSHPQTKKATPKRSFVMALENQIFIGSGYYK